MDLPALMMQMRERVMKIFPRDHNPSRIRLFTFWFILLGLVAVVSAMVATQPSGATQPAATQVFGGANEDTVVVTQSHGVLHVNIPYQARHSGAGRLTVEVLDPDDGV